MNHLPRCRRWLISVATVLLLAGVSLADSSAAGPGGASDPSAMSQSEARVVGGMAGEYWIGVQCRPVDKTLRTQLGLRDRQGLVVEEVVRDGPADKGGIRACDVLVAAAGKPLKSIDDLAEAVEAAKGEQLAMELIRGGERTEITVKPARRPEEHRPALRGSRFGSELEMLRKWFAEPLPGSSLRFRFFRPGMILPPDAPAHPPLPNNVTITIVKQGGQLATITVSRDGKTWEVTENQLDELPKDLRPYVEQMLGGVRSGLLDPIQFFDFVPEGNSRLPDDAERSATVPDSKASLEKRLEAMDRELDQLRRSLDQLREERAPKL